MRKPQEQHCDISAAGRGHLIQRVLVDGWTPAEAGQLVGVDERQVRRWLSNYRRHGMASLRADPAEKMPPRWLGWLRRLITRRITVTPASASRVVLQRDDEWRHRV